MDADDLNPQTQPTSAPDTSAPLWVRGPDPSLQQHRQVRHGGADDGRRVDWVRPSDFGRLTTGWASGHAAKLADLGMFGRSARGRSQGKTPTL